MAHERIKPEFMFDEEKIKQLKQIAPECFEDGKLNFETLRQNLGDWAQDEEDGDLEHFGLFWPGKKDARRLATIPPEGTLEPVYGEGLKADGTPDDDGVNDSKNIFIEGENLEVLKILQKSYANKIKMIYIDPPYNTGNDFVYDDDFTEPLQEYLRRTGQVDEEGKPLTTNKKSDGRFHSKWLSMMYPRLRLARNLLKEDGVIFVSIDDNEVHHLKAVMNEVFGAENSITVPLIWDLPSGINAGHIARAHEYILVYAKNKDNLPLFLREVPKTSIERCNKKIDQRHPASDLLIKKGIRYEGKDQIMEGVIDGSEEIRIKGRLKFENGYLAEDVTLEAGWTMKDMFKKWENGEKVLDLKGQEITDFFFKENGRLYSIKELRVISPKSVMKGYGGSQEARVELEKYFGSQDIFSYPKPTKLIRKLISYVVKEGDIVMDFFAGSGTTGEAAMNFDNKKVQFILVQFPEVLEKTNTDQKAAYDFIVKNKLNKNLAELTKFRLKNVAKEMQLGLSCFKLTSSNYRKWDDFQSEDISQLENSLELFNNSPLKDDWNKNKLITELILLEGFPLDATQSKSTIGSNEIVKVESEMVPNTLLICLNVEIEESLIDQLELDNTSTFICLDSAISNQNKLRLSDKGLIKTI